MLPFCLLGDQGASKVINEVAERLCVNLSKIEDAYPCTPPQESLITQTVADSSASVAQSTYKLPRHCAVGKLQDAWREVVNANPILRTRIVQTDTGAVQAVLGGQPELLHGSDLKTYLDLDRTRGMCLDGSLLRIAFNTETDKEDKQARNATW